VAVVAESAQLAPDAGATNVTVAPLNAVPFEVTFATKAAVKAAPTCVLWFDPLAAEMAMVGGGAAVFVKEKLAGVTAPDVDAVTEYDPVVELAVHVTDALPLALVMAVVAESAQLTPDAGAENVTVAPFTAVPFEVTFATKGKVKAAPTCALWFDPLAAVMAMVGATLAVFVKAKLADVVAPDVEAVTL